MKKKMRFLFMGILLIATVLFSTFIFASTTSVKPNDYYSDVVNSSDWSKMTRPERVAACQFPIEFLQSLDTDELLRVVLDYPFFADALAFNTSREGFLRVLAESTALQELLKREARAEVLINQYAQTAIVTTSDADTFKDSFSDLWRLEILLAQPEISNGMSSQQISEMLTIAKKKYEEKEENSKLYSGFKSLFFQSLNENKDVSIYRYNDYVQTPNGSDVYVSVWQSSDIDFSYAEVKALEEDIASSYPNAKLLRDATRKYNCHSYAWYSEDNDNIYWMPYPGAFITDGSYDELTKITTSVGDRIVYYDTVNGTFDTPTHTAVIYSYKDYPRARRTFVVDSKWGSCGLYRHDSSDSPYSYVGPSVCDIKYFE